MNVVLKYVALIYLTIVLFSSSLWAQVELFPSKADQGNAVKIPYNQSNEYLFYLYKLNTSILYNITAIPFHSSDSIGLKIGKKNYSFFPVKERDTVRVEDDFKTQILNLQIDFHYLPIRLKYKSNYFMEDKSFTLIVSPQNGDDKFFSVIIEKQNLTGELHVDPLVDHDIRIHPYFGNHELIIETYIYDEKLDDPLIGLYANFIEYEGVADFDPITNLSFRINGKVIDDFWGTPLNADIQRNINKGEKKKIEIVSTGLAPGSYKIKMGFTALNNKILKGEEVSVIIKAKHYWYYPFLMILIAVGFSFFMNIWIKNIKERIKIKRQMNSLDKEWLKEEPSVASIKVLSTLSQVNKLSNRWFIPSLEIIKEMLVTATKLNGFLRQVRVIANKIAVVGDEMERRRAKKKLVGIRRMIGEYDLTDDREIEISEKIKSLQSWFEPAGQFQVHYTKNLESDIEILYKKINNKKFEKFKNENSEFIKKVIDAFKDKDENGKTSEREVNYAAMKVIWERIEEDGVEELVSMYKENKDLQELFDEVDKQAFEQISSISDEICLVSPTANSKLEALKPITFQLGFKKNLGLEKTFLFKHGLKYHWTIKINHKNSNKTEDLTPVTDEPKVVQFSPFASSKVDVSVKAYYKTEEMSIAKLESVRVGPALIFGDDKWLQRTEIIATVGATIVAVITGMLTLYVDNPTFGSIKDYLGLFLVGAGIDQTKNFLTRLKNY